MVEIEQHQPAGEQAVQHRAPALVAGKDLAAVEQHELVGLGADQRDMPAAHRVDLVDRAVGLEHPLGEGMRIGELGEGVADQRVALLARNMVERTRRQAVAPAFGAELAGRMGREADHRLLLDTYLRVSNLAG